MHKCYIRRLNLNFDLSKKKINITPITSQLSNAEQIMYTPEAMKLMRLLDACVRQAEELFMNVLSAIGHS